MSALPMGREPFPHPIQARTVAEFLGLLRLILAWSGRTAGQISAVVGKTQLPRSTAYRFIATSNTALPKERRQVGLFVQACGLNEGQVERVLRLWDELQAAPVAVEAEVVDLISRELVRREDPAHGGRAVVRPEVTDAVARVIRDDAEASSLVDELVGRVSGNSVVRDVVVHGNVNVTVNSSSTTENSGPDHARLDHAGVAHVVADHVVADAVRERTQPMWLYLLTNQRAVRNLVTLALTAMVMLIGVAALIIMIIRPDGSTVLSGVMALSGVVVVLSTRLLRSSARDKPAE